MSPVHRKTDCDGAADALSGTIPAGAPDWITAELIQRTIEVWQPYYSEVISAEEAVEMIRSVGRLIDAFAPESKCRG